VYLLSKSEEVFFFLYFCHIHFTIVVLKESLEFSYMIKLDRLENFHSLVKYGKCTFENVEIYHW